MSGLKLISATDTQYSGTLLKALNEQRNHGLFCDITIIIQDRKFRAHKSILSASSTYFHKLFSVAGQVIEMNFMRAEIFEEILNYIYSSRIIRVRSDKLEELINAGETLGVKFIANLGVPLSQVKGLPGLSKDTESKDASSAEKHDTESAGMMPIITESFSLSAEDFNQSDTNANKGHDSDSDDVMFVSKTEAQKGKKPSPSEIIDLDGPDTDEDIVSVTKDQGKRCKPTLLKGASSKLSPLTQQDHSRPGSSPGRLPGSPMFSLDISTNFPPSPGGDSSCSTPPTPRRSSTPPTPRRSILTPEPHSTSLPLENHDIVGVHKKQVTTTLEKSPAGQGDFRIKLLDVKSPGRDVNTAGPNIPETITLDKASEIDSLSRGCKVYANVGENTYDIVPMKDDPGEGNSKNGRGKKCRRTTLETPLSPKPPSKKKAKLKREGHYELIMDGKTFYVCVICKRPYVCLTSLRRHFNTHSWERKYPCHYCDKVFAMAEYRTKHEIHHTGERRYQCLMCDDTFITYQLLSTHCKQAHNQDPSGRKEKEDAENTLYRLLPCKTLQLKSYSFVCEDAGSIPVINEEGIVHQVNPNLTNYAGSSAEGKMLNWEDMFVEPEADVPPVGSEFEFVIPETY